MSSNSSMSPIKTLQTGYIVRLLYVALGMLFAVHLFGTIGYMVLTEGKYSWFDCFYMTFITVATIGFGEIIDMSSNQPARILTVVIGILGAGNLSLLFSVVTVALLETDLNGTLRRKRMEKTIRNGWRSTRKKIRDSCICTVMPATTTSWLRPIWKMPRACLR